MSSLLLSFFHRVSKKVYPIDQKIIIKMRYIFILILFASCTKEEFTQEDFQKTRIAIAEDGDHMFNIKSDTLQRGDTIMYEFDGASYQLFQGNSIAIVTKIQYK